MLSAFSALTLLAGQQKGIGL